MVGPTRVYVSAHRIGRGVQAGSPERPITVEHPTGALSEARHVDLLGPACVRYAPEAPNPAGARCWIETYGEVRVDDDPDHQRS